MTRIIFHHLEYLGTVLSANPPAISMAISQKSHPMIRNHRRIIPAMLLAIPSCIPVSDMEDAWKKAGLDPKLEGQWKLSHAGSRYQDEFLSIEKSEDEYRVRRIRAEDVPPPERFDRGRCLTAGKHSFLLLRSLLGKGVQRYKIDGNVLELIFADDRVLADAVRKSAIPARIPEQPPVPGDPFEVGSSDPPTLTKLDEATLRFLETFCEDPAGWTRVERFERIQNLETAIQESRRYPATKETPRNATVRIDQPDLKYFAEGKIHLLRRHLQSSPEWRVSDDSGEIICDRRGMGPEEWSVSHYDSQGGRDPDVVQVYPHFRFAKRGGGSYRNPSLRSCLTEAAPLAGDLQLALKEDRGIESYLAVGQEGLWFEFFELSKRESRTQTREALAWLTSLLKGLREAEAEIETKGYASKFIPGGGVRKGISNMKVSDGFQGGMYDVYGWINPAQPGQVYLKVFDVKTGDRLSKGEVFERSNEFVGWSSIPEELFFYNSHVIISEGDWSHFYDARFELWFKPENGDPERKLVETVRKICGWEQ